MLKYTFIVFASDENLQTEAIRDSSAIVFTMTNLSPAFTQQASKLSVFL